MIKVYLDDERPCPDGWVLAKTAPEAIALLEKGEVCEVSLDHDLGCCKQCNADYDGPGIPTECVHNGNGYQVACWIEEKAHTQRAWNVPVITVHSQNPVGRNRITQTIESINRIVDRRTTSRI